MNKYILSQNKSNYNLNHAGSKATLDVERYLKSRGYENIQVSDILTNNRYKRILIVFLCKLKNMKKIKSNSIVLMHYPIGFGTVQNILQKFYIEKIENSIALIHDLESIRVYKGTELYDTKVKEEIINLNKFKYVISHNEIMSKWLIDNGLNSKIINLEVFDYYSEYNFKEAKFNGENIKIAFAGNLSKDKSQFIYSLNELNFTKVKFNLYGVNYEKIENKCDFIDYKGVFKPEELTSVINEDYGLIWDGKSFETCTGNIGEYTKYNNPHKLSMYIASGVPVIVWKESAISKFVEKYSIGISIDDIRDIEMVLNDIDEEKYNEMKNNIEKVRKKVLRGDFIKNAIDKIENDIDNN